MDKTLGEAAVKNFNGGVIFLSYVISVIGCQTTLELFTRRTHIKGLYNWFLLTAASFVMGAVSIWSMHFIGNNSLRLCFGSESHQLVYGAGYTFASLVVAVVCMFIAFISVGITEDARLSRIIPSGIFAGLGITCMHYMGQFAIEYFVLVYSIAYLMGAIIIACAAVTIALYIFFKLRERWMNDWYKRLGCALLMALAVCGMHYTGLVGTDFYIPPEGQQAPVAKLQEPALIGIISAVIICCCVGLLYVSIKAGIKTLPKYISTRKKTSYRKRLILNTVLFNPSGRILVKVDGTLPMTTIVFHLEWMYLHAMNNPPSGNRPPHHLNQPYLNQHQEFNTSHPLFARLMQTSIDKAAAATSSTHRLLSAKRLSVTSNSSSSTTTTMEIYDTIEKGFLEGWRELKDELRFQTLADLGILSDNVITTDTIALPPSTPTSSFKLFHQKTADKTASSITSSSKMDVLANHHKIKKHVFHMKKYHNTSRTSTATTVIPTATAADITAPPKRKVAKDKEPVMESSYDTLSSGVAPTQGPQSRPSILANNSNSDSFLPSSANASLDDILYQKESRISLDDVDGENKHIFLVRRLTDEQQAQRLLAQGYRFADPVFIAKTMAVKLRIPTDTMRYYFTDMQQQADSVNALTQLHWPLSSPLSSPTEARPQEKPTFHPTVFRASTRPTVQMGAFVLLDESRDLTDMHILVEKARRYTFPLIQLTLEDGTIVEKLDADEIEFLNRLKGRSLYDFLDLAQTVLSLKQEEKHETIQDTAIPMDDPSRKEQTEDAAAEEASFYNPCSVLDENNSSSASLESKSNNVNHTMKKTNEQQRKASSLASVRPEFIRALEQAAEKLIHTTSYSKALFQSSKLSMHSSCSSSILDLPPFAITTGPCQLICFTSFVTTRGAAAAVNHTFTESIKSIPLAIYKPLCAHITDQAASIYQKSKLLRPLSARPSSYLLLQQQQLYNHQTAMTSSEAIPLDTLHPKNDRDRTSIASSSSSTHPTATTLPAIALNDKKEDENQKHPPHSTLLTKVSDEPAPAFSLPPPPRMTKKNRFKLANVLLNNNNPTSDSHYSNSHRSSSANNVITATTATAATFLLNHSRSDGPSLTVLTTQDRFWWINSVVENTIHNSQ
ncbi:hypothetical protein BDF20DRAFT_998531 [Mycotypha africana]|uniref:uncharacterized protein n=1 Tax=Mycotypha africana TaxID=64632 RepID=UPI002301056F|nr:uncharacterized protein BDF20DRAFT_998531 [Mycotypha africana]KAI8987998.1 hypothetical protein BDF20DRAFT_998531 [Mycotypha africana]